MQMVHTAAVPPNQGRMILAISGCTWNSRKALRKIVEANKAMVGSRKRALRTRVRSVRVASEGAGVDAAVDQEVLAGDVAGLRAAEKGAGVAEFLRRAEASRGNGFLQALPHFFHRLAFFPGLEFGVALQPVG